MSVSERARVMIVGIGLGLSMGCQVAVSSNTASLGGDDSCMLEPDPLDGNAKCDDRPRIDEKLLGFTCFEAGVEMPGATSELDAQQKCAAWLIKSNKIEINADFSKKACGECPTGAKGCQVAHPYDDPGPLGDNYLVGDLWVNRVGDKYYCGKCIDPDRPNQKINVWFRCTHCVADC